MASELLRIQSFLQAYVLAISAILEAEVTVVDKDLVRVSGTGLFAARVGERLLRPSLFSRMLEGEGSGMVTYLRGEDPCDICPCDVDCRELVSFTYPVCMDGQVAGLISITAFKEDEKKRLLRSQRKLNDFLKYMSMLIESKLMAERSCANLEQQIQEVIADRRKSLVNSPFIGDDPEINRIIELVGKLSESDSTVLISGESGTGKEVLAKVIHEHSSRRNKLMITVNCGAIPETLMESELFGYEDGAFTGARRSGHVGKFELANNSTIFLDEISELPYSSQVKLLRVLQEQTVERLGGKKQIPVNIRVICATNKNLAELVKQKQFRQDLYYRLNVIPITMPPLRRRKADIIPLVTYWINYYNKKLHKNIKGMDEETKELLVTYSWPGNVRELRNVVEYLVNILDSNMIRSRDLPDQFFLHMDQEDLGRTLDGMKNEYERHILARLVSKLPPDVSKESLARQLGISRATLYRKLAGHGLI